MKKLLFILALVSALPTNCIAQGVGINTTPDASAALDVVSISKGMLVPRVTTSQRTGITEPAKGLMVYDSTLNKFYFHNGMAWSAVGESLSNGASLVLIARKSAAPNPCQSLQRVPTTWYTTMSSVLRQRAPTTLLPMPTLLPPPVST